MADNLEDYAAGVGPGAYVPQQGSLLPTGMQGGMPLGGSPTAPMPTAGPAPTFQRAPIAQFGGPVPNLEQMIQQRLQRIAGFNPARASIADEDAYAYALAELPKLQGLANVRSQDRQLQEKNLSELSALADRFHKDYTPEVQAQVRPIYEQLLRSRAQLAGRDLPDDVVKQALTSPDFASSAAAMFNDPLWQQDRQQIEADLNRTKTPADREAVLKRWKGQKEQEALTFIQANLPAAIQKLGGTPNTPIEVSKLLSDPEIKQYVEKSQTLKQALQGYLNKKENSEALSAIGLLTGDVIQAGQKEAAKIRAQGPGSSTEVKDVLAGWMGPDRQPLTPASAAALPEGSTITDAMTGKPIPGVTSGAAALGMAKKIAVDNQMNIAAQQGFNAVIAKASAERKLPLIQVQGLEDALVINKHSEMPVDKITTSLDNLSKVGGESKFAVLKGKRAEAFQAAKETEAILGQFLDVVKVMSTKPGGNLIQALEWFGKEKLNLPNADAAVTLSALQGQVLKMARAQQGSAQGLSNLDVNSVSGMLPTSRDGFQTGIKRLEITAKLTRNAIKTQLGDYSPSTLMDDIEKAKREVAGMQGMDIYVNDKGQEIALPRGQSHPGKGWRKK